MKVQYFNRCSRATVDTSSGWRQLANNLRTVWKAIKNGFTTGAQLQSEFESRRGYSHYE